MGRRRRGRRSKRKNLLTDLEMDIAVLDRHRFDNEELEQLRSGLIRAFIVQTELSNRQKNAVHRLAKPLKRRVRPIQARSKIGDYFVYAIHDGTYVKVGYAKDPDDRLKAMQTGNANELTMVAKIRCGRLSDAKRLEKQIHKASKPYHVRGEWFTEDVMEMLGDFKNEIRDNNSAKLDMKHLVSISHLL